MASIGDNSMRKHLRACRRRQKRRVSSRASTLSSAVAQQSSRSHSAQDEASSATESDSVYLVEDILGERIVKGQKYYKVRWQGFPPEADSWEPEENLSGVLEAIQHYHQRQSEDPSKGTDLVKDCPTTSCANSPASLPTPPSTPNCCCSLATRLRGASEERHCHPLGAGAKRKHGPKSRTSGRYEYVPKHELVASKTKYFDDIRDGKIDLSSNDLYSRVKTRRRLTDSANATSTTTTTATATTTGTDSAHSSASTSNSVQGDPEPDCVASPMDPLPVGSLKHEPTSPASDSMNAGGSLSGFQSTVDSTESEQLKPHMTDQIEAFSEPISDITTHGYSIVELETPQDTPIRGTVDNGTQSDELPLSSSMMGIVMTSTSSSYHMKPTSMDVALSPILARENVDGDHMECHADDSLNRSEGALPVLAGLNTTSVDAPSGRSTEDLGTTVSSLRKLVHDYFQLIAYVQRVAQADLSKQENNHNHVGNNNSGHPLSGSVDLIEDDIRSLDDLPRLVNYSPQASIGTREEFLEAVHAQRWNLLSTLLSNHASSPASLKSQPTEAHGSNEIPVLWHGNTDRVTARELLTAALLTGADRPVVLEQLLNAGLDPNESVSDDGVQWPLLAYSVRLRRLHAAQALLDAGASPDSLEPGPKRRTALGMAIAAGDVDMATLLILAGANFYEVEAGTTALSLIMKLINAHSAAPVQLTRLPPLSVAEAQDRRKSLDSDLPPVPPPSPPSGFEIPTVPKSVLFNAIIHSASNPGVFTPPQATTLSTNSSAPHQSHSKWHQACGSTDEVSSRTLGLPSVDSLRRLYDLVAVHHARLSVRVTTLVRNWLTRAGLVQCGLVSPCQWINTRLRTASIRFNWPNHPSHWSKPTAARPVAPVLLLVHGRVAPPACYDVWIDDDGPCLIDTVCLDGSVQQKALGRAPFVTTLFPLKWDSARLSTAGEPHHVEVTFHPPSGAGALRPTCIALMIIAVTPESDQPTAALNGRSLLRPGLSRSALPASNRTVFGSPPHVSRQRSVS